MRNSNFRVNLLEVCGARMKGKQWQIEHIQGEENREFMGKVKWDTFYFSA